jgi:hypothetical protein
LKVHYDQKAGMEMKHRNLLKTLSIAWTAAFLGFAHTAWAFDDPFAPFLDSVPAVKQTIKQEHEGAGASAITIKSFTFGSRNGTSTVYASTEVTLVQSSPNANWPDRQWTSQPAHRVDSVTYMAELSARSVNSGVDYYALVKDDANAFVATDMHNAGIVLGKRNK